jgi:hypothetical protein
VSSSEVTHGHRWDGWLEDRSAVVGSLVCGV